MNIVKSISTSLRLLMMAAAVSAFFGAMPRFALAYINGFDVYNGDGATNFYTAANGGYQFAFVKSTEGVNFVDASFATFMLNAYQVNDASLHALPANPFYVGPYHFGRPNSKDGVPFTTYDGLPFTPNGTNVNPWLDATSEANDFIDAIRPYYYRTFSGYKSSVPTYFLPPVADIEAFPNFGSTSLNRTFVSNWTQLFSDVVYDALGVRPLVYTSKSSANTYYTASVASQHKLWEAWWKGTGTSSPPLQSDTPNWPLWTFWQWSDGTDAIAQASQVPGTSVSVDRDVFNGTTPAQLATQKMPNLIAGDNNHNGAVDGADFVTWRKAMSSPLYAYYSTVFLGGDSDRNDVVNSTDYTYWRARFGNTVSGSGSEFDFGTVPEPWSISLLLSGILSLLFARPRR